MHWFLIVFAFTPVQPESVRHVIGPMLERQCRAVAPGWSDSTCSDDVSDFIRGCQPTLRVFSKGVLDTTYVCNPVALAGQLR